MASLGRMDFFPKVMNDFRSSSMSGAMVSVGVLMLVVYIVLGELMSFLTLEVDTSFRVDPGMDHDRLAISLDVTFPHMSCEYLTLDIMDVTGASQREVSHNMHKRRMDRNGNFLASAERYTALDEVAPFHRGDAAHPAVPLHPAAGVPKHRPLSNDYSLEEKTVGDHVKDSANIATPAHLRPDYCGSCYGASGKDDCCNTCESVREAYRRKGWAFNNEINMEQCKREDWREHFLEHENEGCQMYGTLEVERVAGNFHFSMGKSFLNGRMHIHDLSVFHGMKFNLTHTVNRLSFGRAIPKVSNPLDNRKYVSKDSNEMVQYFVELVPTSWKAGFGLPEISTNQFSSTLQAREINKAKKSFGLPGVFFMYDLSPIGAHYTLGGMTLPQLMVSICTGVGGVFTVGGILHSIYFKSATALSRKRELGKMA